MARTDGAMAITEEEIVAIIERITEGMTLMQSCKKSKRAFSNVVHRISLDSKLKILHAACREEYARAQVEKIHDIATNTKRDAATRRMMIDAIKWESARVLPKEYGDRVQQEVIITNNTTLSQRMQQARARAAAKTIATQLPPEAEE